MSKYVLSNRLRYPAVQASNCPWAISARFVSIITVLSLVNVTINNCANCWTAASRYTTVSDIIRSQPLTKDPKGANRWGHAAHAPKRMVDNGHAVVTYVSYSLGLL